MRRVPAPVLAAGLCRGGSRRCAERAPDLRRRPSGVSRWLGKGRRARTALRAPRHLARVRQGRRARHSLLLPRLALRRGWHDPRHARGTGNQLDTPKDLPRGVPRSCLARRRLRVHGSARGAPAVSYLRCVRALRVAGELAGAPLPVQLAASERERDRSHPSQLSPHSSVRRPVRAGVPGDPHHGMDRDAGRHDLHHGAALGGTTCTFEPTTC